MSVNIIKIQVEGLLDTCATQQQASADDAARTEKLHRPSWPTVQAMNRE